MFARIAVVHAVSRNGGESGTRKKRAKVYRVVTKFVAEPPTATVAGADQ